ncbi:MAG: restriction endonuclease subunit R [Cyanobacteria bacterium P01_F01_bin.150]
MVEILQVRNLELHEVKARFNLSQADDLELFPEWQNYQTACSQLTEHDTYWLDQAKSDFLSLVEYRLHEEVVKLSILSPLLSVAGLSRAPFVPKAEKQVEIEFDDSEEVIRGRIDLVILYRNLWITTIETKPQQADVLEVLPQTLTYMMASPVQSFPLFGLLTNGRHFMFVKLIKQERPVYALSELFTLFRPTNDLHKVAAILRLLKELVLSQDWHKQQAS